MVGTPHFARPASRSAFAALLLAFTPSALLAQKPMEPPKDPNSKVSTVEVTPAQANAAIGDKLQFKAVGKDAAGNALPDKVEFWFAAPTDLGGSNEEGLVSFFGPGEVVVGATIGGTTGYAKVTVSKPHIASIELAPQLSVVTSGSRLLLATPRNKNGDPRSDIALTWTSSDSAVATVDAAGLLRGGKAGKARVKVSGDGVSAESEVTVTANLVATLAIAPATAKARTGDVVHFAADAKDAKGSKVNANVSWSAQGRGANVFADGAFVAETPGTYRVEGSVGGKTAMASVVVAPRDVEREIEVVGHAMPKDEQFAEEWIWDHYAYLSTIDDKVLVYDISDPAHPKAGEPLKVDARLVNDVSVTADGKIGVLSREGASNRKNGIVFVDTTDPMKPKVISEYTATVTGGVHSAYVHSHYVYLTDDATGSLRVIDFRDVKAPKEVARWEVEESAQMQVASPEGVGTAGRYLHDVQVMDGLAYLAYWRDGLVILDVGNGVKGGSPEHPQFVARCRFNYNELYGPGWLAGAHAVYRYKNYVFVGDEVFPAIFKLDTRDRIPVRGIVHVVDVSDLQHPREVATYSVPEAGSHNIWVFDDVLYMGYYNGGARVLDVSGELRGELYDQGREIGRFWSGDSEGYRPNLPFAWGAYPHQGLIYVNDVHGGLWITKLGKHKPYTSTTDSPH
jgi:hypothetical protein